MTKYYTDNDFLEARSQKRHALTIFLIITAIYLGICAVLFVWYRRLPFMADEILTIKILTGVASVIYTIIASVYGGINLRIAIKTYRLAVNLKTGLLETSEATFVRYDNSVGEKDGVDMKSLIFSEWNKYKKEFFERKVLVFDYKEFPKMEENQKYKFITQGNVLIEYEEIQGEDK